MVNKEKRSEVNNNSTEDVLARNFMFLNYQDLKPDTVPNNSIHWTLPPDGVRDIVRGTTPEHFVYLPFNNRDIDSILITYKQGFNVVEKRMKDLSWYVEKGIRNIAYFQFTQEETNSFESILNRPCNVQVRALLKNGDVIASEICKIKILDVLDEEELER